MGAAGFLKCRQIVLVRIATIELNGLALVIQRNIGGTAARDFDRAHFSIRALTIPAARRCAVTGARPRYVRWREVTGHARAVVTDV